jgi:hypothetical protein
MSPFPPQFTLSSLVLPQRNGIECLFPTGSEEISFKQGEFKEYTLTWDQKDGNGKQVSYGLYSLSTKIELIKRDNRGDIAGGGVHDQKITRVLVLPPEGAVEKTQELNQSQNLGDATATLEKIEMSSQKNKVYTLVVPPNFDSSTLDRPWNGVDTIEYTIDNSEWSPLTINDYFSMTYLAGVRNRWDLAPIPKSTREIGIRIKVSHSKSDPVVFKIPLD